MRSGTQTRKTSLVCGSIACLLFTWVSHTTQLGFLYGGNMLGVLDRIGLVHTERSYIVEIKTNSLFALNDVNFFVWLTWLAYLLALMNVCLAIYAESKREVTLYIGAGFVTATVGICLLQPLLMLITWGIGTVILFSIRNGHAAEVPAVTASTPQSLPPPPAPRARSARTRCRSRSHRLQSVSRCCEIAPAHRPQAAHTGPARW